MTNPHHASQRYAGPQPSGPPQPYGPPASWPTRPTRPGVNGFAVAALVLSVVGGILLSVVFAFVALSQVKRTGQRGRGLALASLAVSGLWVLVFGTLVVVAVLSGADRDDSGRISGAGDVSATALRPGDCVGWKAGVANAHCLQNRGDRDAVYLEVGSRRPETDACDYPDIDMVARQGEPFYRHRDGTPYPE